MATAAQSNLNCETLIGSEERRNTASAFSKRKQLTMHLAPGHWAGHMRIYHRGCLSLAQSGFDVELVAHHMDAEQLDPAINLHSLGRYGDPTHSWRIAERLRRCAKTYSLARHSKAAIFQYYSPEFIPWAKQLRQSTERPMVFDCMEDFESYCRQRAGVPNQLRSAMAWLVHILLKAAARHSDAIIVADEGTARFFQGRARRVLVLHNFPQLALFPEELAANMEDKPYDLVYHGSLPRYHLEACLAIDQALLEVGLAARWRLIGTIPDFAWFSQELKRRGIFRRFHVTGLIPHNRVAGEVRKAKLGLIPLPDRPKFRNNIPQKLFEFMALGMPVVLSDLPPSRPFVGDGGCAVMVAANDHRAYADAIHRLLADPALCNKMGSEGRRRVKEHYNWETESRKLIALYQTILG